MLENDSLPKKGDTVMKITTKWLAHLMILGLLGFGVAACDVNQGPAEEAGESIDEGVDEMGDSMEDMGDEMD